MIDDEIRDVIDRNYQRAEQILKDKMDKLHIMSEALIKYETIDKSQIDDIMAGNDVQPPEGWHDDNGKPAKKAPRKQQKPISDADNEQDFSGV